MRVGKFFGNYYLQGLLGRGSFGAVYDAIFIPNGTRVALKFLPLASGVRKTYDAEVASYKVLSSFGDCSPYVVCLLDNGFYNPRLNATSYGEQFENISNLFEAIGLETPDKLETISQSAYYLVNEIMDGDMANFLEFSSNLWKEYPQAFITMATSFIEGLEYIHSKDMAHRDIKPPNMFYIFPEESERGSQNLENYLLNPETSSPIQYLYGDLGFSCTDAMHASSLSEPKVQRCKTGNYTPLYFSPEGIQLQKQRRGELVLFIAQKTDVWALGVSLWEIFFGELPPFLKDLEIYEDLEAVLLSLSSSDIDELFERRPVITNDAIATEKISRVLSGFLRPFAGERITLSQAKQNLVS
jgi:serine/threonine protein kinase